MSTPTKAQIGRPRPNTQNLAAAPSRLGSEIWRNSIVGFLLQILAKRLTPLVAERNKHETASYSFDPPNLKSELL